MFKKKKKKISLFHIFAKFIKKLSIFVLDKHMHALQTRTHARTHTSQL